MLSKIKIQKFIAISTEQTKGGTDYNSVAQFYFPSLAEILSLHF